MIGGQQADVDEYNLFLKFKDFDQARRFNNELERFEYSRVD